MSSNWQFDKHIKEQFSGYTPEVHPRIWENIMTEREKRRPAGFWFTNFASRNKLLLAGILIALITGGSLIYYNYSGSPEAPALSGSGSNNNATEKTTGILSNNDNPSDQQQVSTLITDEVSAGNITPENINSKLHAAASVTVNIFSPSAETTNEGNDLLTSANRNKKKVTGLGSVLVKTTSPGFAEDQYEGQGTLLGRLNFSAEKYSAKQRSRKTGELIFDPIAFLPDCPSFEKDAAGNKKYFEFYAGPDYGFQSLHDTANSSYLQKRKESANFRSAFSAGVRFTRVFKNGMSVRAGVNYSQINEKFKYSEGNIIQVVYIINASGDTIGSYTTNGTRYKTTINRYRSIDVPVVIGYELGNGKWHANINAGAVVNVYSWQKGDVLDTAGRPVSITTGKNSSPYQFKTNAGLGVIGAVSVYYKLNDRMHLMAEPYFRYNISPMNKEESLTLKQKYQTAGVRLGVRLDLK